MNTKILTVIAVITALTAGGGYYYLTSKTQSQPTQVADNQAAVTPASGNKLNPQSSNTTQRVAALSSAAVIEMSPATETARFVTAAAGQSLYPNRNPQVSNGANAMGYLRANGDAFGITNPDQQLKQVSALKDELGYEHIKYQQVYQGLPVFATNLLVHFDAHNNLYSVNGITVPDINVDPTPKISTDKVSQRALAMVERNQPDAQNIVATNAELMVFRSNLVKGTPGANHLAYQVTVTNGSNVNEKVYIDAHTGKFIDQITGIHRHTNHSTLKRRAYDLNGDLLNLPIVYPSQPVWIEGQALPTGNLEIDMGLQASKETYNLYKTAFNYISYDNKNGPMDIAVNWNANNAFAIGVDLPQLTTYGLGNTIDDIVGHEWTHNYTAFTDALVYQYQPGALNESISDIVGETVDRINSDGPYPGIDEPNNPRINGACTILAGNFITYLDINSPASIAGPNPVGNAEFGQQISTPLTGTVVLVNDGVDVTTDACETLINPSEVAGKIALIDRGICEFSSKVKKAQDAGAIAVIVVNNAGDDIFVMGAGEEADNVTIPSVFLGQGNGQIIKDTLAANSIVSVTFNPLTPGTDNSVRWVLGEGAGISRDMYTPTCLGSPGKVSDGAFYTCSATADAGGVHSNSGISNHAYALLTDGGTYNNQTIRGLGLTKALHIYIRAKFFYQHAATQFTDHADALEQSCRDLTGYKVRDLKTGALMNANKITSDDCKQLKKVIAAVEFRKPIPCVNSTNLLAKNPPKLCPFGTHKDPIFVDDFQNEQKNPKWKVTREPVDPSGFLARDWQAKTGGDQLGTQSPVYVGPTSGFSLEAVASPDNDCISNQAGVLHLDSPKIKLRNNGGPIRLSIRHWVNMQADYLPEFGGAFDGANLKISVNGGPFQLVGTSAFTFNPYNTELFPADFSDNPMAGEPVFAGADTQLVDPFYRSLIDLSQYAQPGDTIRLRFDVGTDFCTPVVNLDDTGWHLKRVNVYQCKPGHPNNPHDDDDD